MTGLDILLDAMERGDTVKVLWFDRPATCQHPLNSGLTGYYKGCRCERCHTAKAESARRYVRKPRRTQRQGWNQ